MGFLCQDRIFHVLLPLFGPIVWFQFFAVVVLLVLFHLWWKIYLENHPKCLKHFRPHWRCRVPLFFRMSISVLLLSNWDIVPHWPPIANNPISEYNLRSNHVWLKNEQKVSAKFDRNISIRMITWKSESNKLGVRQCVSVLLQNGANHHIDLIVHTLMLMDSAPHRQHPASMGDWFLFEPFHELPVCHMAL